MPTDAVWKRRYDWVEVEEKVIRVRRGHTCRVCGRPILKGQLARVITYVTWRCVGYSPDGDPREPAHLKYPIFRREYEHYPECPKPKKYVQTTLWEEEP